MHTAEGQMYRGALSGPQECGGNPDPRALGRVISFRALPRAAPRSGKEACWFPHHRGSAHQSQLGPQAPSAARARPVPAIAPRPLSLLPGPPRQPAHCVPAPGRPAEALHHTRPHLGQFGVPEATPPLPTTTLSSLDTYFPAAVRPAPLPGGPSSHSLKSCLHT